VLDIKQARHVFIYLRSADIGVVHLLFVPVADGFTCVCNPTAGVPKRYHPRRLDALIDWRWRVSTSYQREELSDFSPENYER
jgi:hypothetical protein